MRRIMAVKMHHADGKVIVYHDPDWQEYRCVPVVDGAIVQSAVYHTDAKDDAIATAIEMAGNWKKEI